MSWPDTVRLEYVENAALSVLVLGASWLPCASDRVFAGIGTLALRCFAAFALGVIVRLRSTACALTSFYGMALGCSRRESRTPGVGTPLMAGYRLMKLAWPIRAGIFNRLRYMAAI